MDQFDIPQSNNAGKPRPGYLRLVNDAGVLVTRDANGVEVPAGGLPTQADLQAAITNPEAFRDVLGVIGETPDASAVTYAAAVGLSESEFTRVNWCLNELTAGDIRDALLDAYFFRPGQNAATPQSLTGLVATVNGTIPITPDGLLFENTIANRMIFTVPDASGPYTLVSDVRSDPAVAADASYVCLVSASGTNDTGHFIGTGSGVGGAGYIFTAGGGAATSSAFVDTHAFTLHRYNPNDTIIAFSTDDEASPTLTGYCNGALIVTDSSSNKQATGALTRLIFGARQTTGVPAYDLPYKGTTGSALQFGRVLTAAEHLTAAKALRHLDPREENLVVYGDSRSAHLSVSTKVTGNWPIQAILSPGLARKCRLVNGASNGWTSGTGVTNFAARVTPFSPNGKSVKRATLVLWFGANDWLAAVSAATAWANMKTMLRAARALGYRTVCCTDPEAGTTYSGPQEAERVAFNALVLANPVEYDAAWDLDGIVGTAHDAGLWLDEIHLNNEGNRTLADNYLKGGQSRPVAFT